ncbi:hypothetical protein [Trinickia diaoshuihuensis]|uniref:hypothetical protein n=1 Tax=Trinickia diaoshuihuensis TaxID=2292265 RepID=UPI000E2770EC|nr:hypothetical protein [Trinickia diaoshuihuensis]
MKITLETIMRVSGSAEDDQRVANEFSREAIAEAEARFENLNTLRSGKAILDDAGIRAAKNALAGIRHLHALLQEVVEFHRRSELQSVFVAAHKKIGEMLEKAETIYLRLSSLYPGRR